MGVGRLVFNAESFTASDGESDASTLIFPNKIDFSKYRYIYLEGKKTGAAYCGLVTTNYYGEGNHFISLLKNGMVVETTPRGNVVRSETSGEGYLAMQCTNSVGSGSFTVYRIWLEE